MVLETQASRNLAGLLSLGLLLIASCVMIYVLQEKSSDGHTAGELKEMFLQAVQMLGKRQTDQALTAFDRLATFTENAQPMKNWIRMNGALTTLVAGDEKEAARRFGEIEKDGHYSVEEAERLLASFFVEASKQLAKPQTRIPASITKLYSDTNFEAFGLLCFALHDWEIGEFEDASSILDTFLKAKIPKSENWIEDYKPLAADYYGDCNLLAPIEKALPKAIDAASAQALVEEVRRARESLRTRGRAHARLEAIERQLIANGANPKVL